MPFVGTFVLVYLCFFSYFCTANQKQKYHEKVILLIVLLFSNQCFCTSFLECFFGCVLSYAYCREICS